MSSFLYALAHGAVRRKVAVLIAWLAVLAILGSAAGVFGKSFDNAFTLPGTESQRALDSLKVTFPQVSGSSAQVIVIAPPGKSVRAGATKTAIEDGVKAFENVGDVAAVSSPFSDRVKDVISADNARAVATAGSAVVFAGLTVIIALCGLSVAGIPFLSTMGIAAAVGVVVAVLIALTLLPALLAMAGDKLRPGQRAIKKHAKATAKAVATGRHQVGNGQPSDGPPPAPVLKEPKHRLGRGWVRLVTKVPVLTIVIVVAALAALAWPAQSLRLSLPDKAAADIGTPARTTYDLVADRFGPGYNGALVVSARIVGSDDPLGVMNKMADRIRVLPGVASIPLATLNETANTGIIQVVPTTAPDAPATSELVNRIRALEPEFQTDYGVRTAVTGVTAVQIDVSNRLGSALLPFGILVVGLSLVLLTMVFRSIAVPIKATLGYLLSVLASFGAVSIVFIHGHFAGALNVAHVGPVLSFLPVLLMGILFGLAMDYEVFLVSRIREDFVHDGGLRSGDPHQAIETGFIASSRVVVAAAIIMFAVFAAFVPEGSNEIKTIAFGLAVGVFVDAFIVRMTLVPAVLALLGRTAWTLPRWLDRRLPSLDIEGEALAHQLALADWPDPGNNDAIYAENVSGAGFDPVDVVVAPGQVAIAESGPATTALMCTLSGRMHAGGGETRPWAGCCRSRRPASGAGRR